MELKKFINYIEKCCSIASDLKLELIFSIHQTTNFSNINPYTLPPRKSKKILLCGICNLGQEEILELASLFQEKIDYFLVDLEKKGIIGTNEKTSKLLTGNLEGRLKEIINKKKIIGIRYDALTSEHVINLIIKLNPFLYKTKIGIIGLGKIGFKIAISLLECGNNIEIYTRDYEALYKKCTCMDLIKPESTYARPIPHRSLEACIHQKDIIILATTSQNIINEKLVSIIKPKSVIYSIGHGEISPVALKKLKERPDIKICRIDIGLSLMKYVERLVFDKEIIPKVKQINKGRIISGGFLGMPGDIVVDNVDDPGLIYGYISNKNIFVRDIKKYND